MEEKNKLLYIDPDPSLYGRSYMGMFDLTKGFVMFWIVVMHCVYRYFSILRYDGGAHWLGKLLVSPFALTTYGIVPMLFMLCGYGIRRQSLTKNVKNQLSVFLFPYICVILCLSLSEFLKWWILGGDLGARLTSQVLRFCLGFHPGGHLLKGGATQIGPIWFFFTYTFGSIYLNWILQEKRGWVQLLLLAVSTGAGLILQGVILPFCFQQILICSGFLYAGMQLKRWKIPYQKLPWTAFMLIWALCVVSRTFGGMAEIGNNTYRFGALDLMTAYLAGIVLLCLFLRLNVLQGVIPDGLRWIGRRMMWICCIHTVSELAMPWGMIEKLFADRPLAGLLLEILTSLAFACVGVTVLSICVRKVLAARKRHV